MAVSLGHGFEQGSHTQDVVGAQRNFEGTLSLTSPQGLLPMALNPPPHFSYVTT